MSDAGSAPVLVKICGLRDPSRAKVAIDAGADFLGVVFAESKRLVTVEQARAIRAATGPRVEVVDASAEAFAAARRAAGRPLLVGVFADQPPDEINRIIAATDLDLIQLSGGEHPSLAARLTRPALRAIHVAAEGAAGEVLTEARRPPATVTLLDAQDAAARGGTGRTFDWSLAAAVAGERAIMLAGGLTPENVAEAVRTVRPWAVDVSTGVESGGVKDPGKIRAFLAAARAACDAPATRGAGA